MTDDGREEYSNERGVKVDSFGFFFWLYSLLRIQIIWSVGKAWFSIFV